MPDQQPKLGGTDGYRKIATLEPGPGQMNPETVAGLTYALVSKQIEAGASDIGVIGYDTRPSGPALERAAVAGAVAAGATVLRMSIAPTPAVLRTARTVGAGFAVSMSASHNAWQHNGWKGTLGEDKPFGPQVKAISDRYWQQVDSGLVIPLDGADTIPVRPELRQDYVDSVIANMEAEFGERPLEGKVVVVDGANGAAKDVTPGVLGRLGATVYTYACDGAQPINEGSGATDLSGVQQYLRDHPEIARNPNFIGVVANDGDADRMIGLGVTVNASGELLFDKLEGNRVMELQAIGQPGIVGTDYSNDAMVNRLRAQGTGFEFCENGDVYVTAALRATQDTHPENPWTRGGEFTGHHVNLEWLSSGDGVRMAAWALCYAAKNGTTFAELCRTMPLWKERMDEVRLDPQISEHILEDAEVAAAIAEADAKLLGTGRTHVRNSGTEAGIARVWGVGKDEQIMNTAIDGIVATIKKRARQKQQLLSALTTA